MALGILLQLSYSGTDNMRQNLGLDQFNKRKIEENTYFACYLFSFKQIYVIIAKRFAECTILGIF